MLREEEEGGEVSEAMGRDTALGNGCWGSEGERGSQREAGLGDRWEEGKGVRGKPVRKREGERGL